MRRGPRSLAALIFFIALSSFSASPAAAAPGKCDVPLIDPVCEAGKTVAGAAGKVVTAPLRYAAGSAVEMVTTWVTDAAKWAVDKVIGLMDDSTSPNLEAGWFTERYRFMVAMAALVILPMLLMAAIRALMTQDGSQLVRSFFVYLPVAIFGTFIAVFLSQSLLAVTDAMSAAVAESIGGDVTQTFAAAGETLTTPSPSAARPLFAIFFGALILIVGSFVVWLELIIRSAAVTVSVFFLPVILAALVWPATARWTKRLIQTLVALIFSKFVIVAVISLATAALGEPGRGGFSAVMSGAALMTMAAFSPFALLKLFPVMEEAAIGHLQGMARKPIDAVRPGGAVNQAVSVMRSKTSSGSNGNGTGAGTQGAGAAGAGTNGARAAAKGAKGASQKPGKRMERQTDASSASPGRSHKETAKRGGAATTRSARRSPPKGSRKKQ